VSDSADQGGGGLAVVAGVLIGALAIGRGVSLPGGTDEGAAIPAVYAGLYKSSARVCPGLPWGVLAGIGKVESDHGRSPLPGVRSGANSAGAMRPMQFLRGAWRQYGRGGNVYDPAAAIPAAARKLCADGARRDLRGAVHAYNHDWAYVDRVVSLGHSYQGGW
jgi:hypothetical protein